MTHTNPTKQSGFTLIELSIVLVIIGLIVGGVLVGQDLIKGAEIRATVSQLEKYDAAANTFRNKYGGLPGDLADQANFGFEGNGSYDTAPNGNGRLDRSADDGTALNNEAAAFFRQLSQAALISDNIVGTTFDAGSAGPLADFVPLAKLGGGGFIVALSVSGLNYYAIIRGGVTDGAALTFSTTAEMRVIDAFQIDSKMDDGVANSGRVMAVSNFNTVDATGDCHASGTYATAASANQTVCMLRIRTSF